MGGNVSHECQYGENRSHRYLLARLVGNDAAIEWIRAELGDCTKCWITFGDCLATELANDRALRARSVEGAARSIEAELLERLGC